MTDQPPGSGPTEHNLPEHDPPEHDPPEHDPPEQGLPEQDLPEHDLLLDERGRLCPLPIIALGRAATLDPPPSRVLLLADDPAAETDVPAWCALRGRTLAWTGPAPDGRGRAYLVTVTDHPPPTEVLDL